MYEVSVARQSTIHTLWLICSISYEIFMSFKETHTTSHSISELLGFSFVFNISVYTHWHTNLSAIYLSQNHLLNQVNIVSRFLVRFRRQCFAHFLSTLFSFKFFLSYLLMCNTFPQIPNRMLLKYHSSNIRMFLNKILKC